MDLVNIKTFPTGATEPPLLFDFTNEELEEGARTNNLVLDIPPIPNHSQNNERAVQNTTKAVLRYRL